MSDPSASSHHHRCDETPLDPGGASVERENEDVGRGGDDDHILPHALASSKDRLLNSEPHPRRTRSPPKAPGPLGAEGCPGG